MNDVIGKNAERVQQVDRPASVDAGHMATIANLDAMLAMHYEVLQLHAKQLGVVNDRQAHFERVTLRYLYWLVFGFVTLSGAFGIMAVRL